MKYTILIFLLGLSAFSAWAQKPLTVTQCEELFFKNNLMLLAEQLNVDVAKAAIIQARIWDLPYGYAELNALNPSTPARVFDVGSQGQKVFAIQQLIYLGGKKKNEIALAKSSSQMAELQLEDLLRNLRYELKHSYYTLYFTQSEIQITDKQIANLDTLIRAYRVQAAKGNVPMKDLVRLQALFFDLKNQRTELLNTYIEEKEKIKLITGTSEDFVPTKDTFEKLFAGKSPDQFSLDTLMSLALAYRPDFLLATKNIEVSNWNLKWQKSLAVPDVTLGLAYDQRGGAFNNQTNVTLGIPLPLWNRNRGNIKIAESQYKQAEVYKLFAADRVRTEVEATFLKWSEAYSNYRFYVQSNSKAFDEVYEGAVKNFARKNITIIEFSDFMESYNQSMMHFNEIERNLVIISEELNKTVHFKALN